MEDTTTTAVSTLSRQSSWSGKTAVATLAGRPSTAKYPATPKLPFPTVLETDLELGPNCPNSPTSATFPPPPTTTSPPAKPSRPSRPFPSVDLTFVRGSKDSKPPPPEQFWFSGQSQAQASVPRLDKRTATAVFATSPDKGKGLLRRALDTSISHVRTLSTGSLARIRSLSRRTGCRRASVYEPPFVTPDTLPTKLEPASPPPHRQTSRMSRVILQVPRAEPLLPAVLQAADDVSLALALAELTFIVTPRKKTEKRISCEFEAKLGAARPDSQLLPASIDFALPALRRRESVPTDFGPQMGRPVVSCSRRASRPVWTYI